MADRTPEAVPRGRTTREHSYQARIVWTGAGATGTLDYTSYSRAYTVEWDGKPSLAGSSDPQFRGDPHRVNPEEMLVASLAACHLLWYLHLCAVGGVVVTSYQDAATGTLAVERDGGGRFVRVTLRPKVEIRRGDLAVARRLHEDAHRKCFVANSVNFPVDVEPTVSTGSPGRDDAGIGSSGRAPPTE